MSKRKVPDINTPTPHSKRYKTKNRQKTSLQQRPAQIANVSSTKNRQTTLLQQRPAQIANVANVSHIVQRLDTLEHRGKKIRVGIQQIEYMEKNIRLKHENARLQKENNFLKKQNQQIHKIYNDYKSTTQKNQELINENIKLKQQIAQLKEESKNKNDSSLAGVPPQHNINRINEIEHTRNFFNNNLSHAMSPPYHNTSLLNEEHNRNVFNDHYSINPTISPPPYGSINSINNLNPELFNTHDQDNEDDDLTHTNNTSTSFLNNKF